MAKYILKVFTKIPYSKIPKVRIQDTNGENVTDFFTLKINSFKHKLQYFYQFYYNGDGELYPVFMSDILGEVYDYEIKKM